MIWLHLNNYDMKTIKLVLFDFGGVLADEGFKNGLYAIAHKNGVDKDSFFALASEAVYDSGYIAGAGSESDFWNMVREKSGITGSDRQLSEEILSRFIPRPAMMEIVRTLGKNSIRTAILSDQSDWLDRLDKKYAFFKEFEVVYNSYHLGKSKKDPTAFVDAAQSLNLHPAEILFTDDNSGHIKRAASCSMQTHLFSSVPAFRRDLERLSLLPPPPT